MQLVTWFISALTSKAQKTLRRGLLRRLELEPLEERLVLSGSPLSAIDGTGNNLTNTNWGSAGTDLLRVSPAAYADGHSTPSLPNAPSARVVSDLLNNQALPGTTSDDVATLDQNSLSDFGYVWGQFIDHDMSLTPTGTSETLTITADPNDPLKMGDQTFSRSIYDAATGTTNPRQQVNAVTSYLDLSQVYGSSTALADALRTHTGGLLKSSPGNMLPYDNSTYFTPAQLSLIHMANDSGMVATKNLFVTGDVRGNENVELTAVQTLFMRNHNRLAGELQTAHPTWSDEQIYQEARKLNIAGYQQITYNQYLPDLLGPNALPRYNGYHANVDAAIATEFSTVAFRFGHSLLSAQIERHTNSGQDAVPNDPAGNTISLATDFFDPNVLNPQGVVDPLTGHISTDIDAILKGDADGVSQADDLMAINDIRNVLFGNSGQKDNGLDLMARDVERARDDGIGSYNQVRAAYGLAPVTSFSQITRNVQVQQQLQKAYGSVNNLDPFEAGLAEDHVPGSDMGPLFTRIIADQFTRLRDGDRFYYQNQSLTSEEMALMQQGVTLTKVIQANTHITNLQADAFVFKATISGSVLLPPPPGLGKPGPGTPPPAGLQGIVVQLLNADGIVVATTRTDAAGHYTFTQQSGLSSSATTSSGVSATGSYTVAVMLPPGFKQLAGATSAITIGSGDSNVQGVDFIVLPPNFQPPPPPPNRPGR